MAICTLLDGLIRSFMILASGGDLHLGVYLLHMVVPVLFGMAYWELLCMACCGVKRNSKIIFGKFG